MSSLITLTNDQEHALQEFCAFMVDPLESVFVLSGYSGTGKSTMVKEILTRLPAYMKTVRLINLQLPEYETALTATTNKAAENFAHLSGMEVKTIHAFLGLRVSTNFQTNTTTLIPRTSVKKSGYLLVIDEASYVDSQLLGLIFALTEHCKILFIGDPAQLTPVKSSGTPVFNGKFPGARLNEVVRQTKDNPIIELSTKFRNTVNTGEFFSFKPDGQAIQHMPRIEFQAAIENEFSRPNWQFRDSKILVWTNKAAIGHNHYVADLVKGNPDFNVGDYAVCNKVVTSGRLSIKTDQMVQITDISQDTEVYGVLGNFFTLDKTMRFFGPKTLESKKLFIKTARANEDYVAVEQAESTWIDLRAAYACTINKSQGSTFDKVYIDLDDIRRCNSGDQIARMMYVGVSRARQQVFLTGDFV
jgi:hypothetical protein